MHSKHEMWDSCRELNWYRIIVLNDSLSSFSNRKCIWNHTFWMVTFRRPWPGAGPGVGLVVAADRLHYSPILMCWGTPCSPSQSSMGCSWYCKSLCKIGLLEAWTKISMHIKILFSKHTTWYNLSWWSVMNKINLIACKTFKKIFLMNLQCFVLSTCMKLW